MGFAFSADAAPRAAVRNTATTARRSVSVSATTTQPTTAPVSEPTTTLTTTTPESAEPEITNRSSNFEISVNSASDSGTSDNSFAEMIQKQRAAFAANEATSAVATAQQESLKTSSNTCDRDLRKCMATKCGNDFTKCALDGATIFGDKLNACRRDTECTAEEFRLFTTEIQADLDMNVKMSSYENVITCGNQYNACLLNECGKTYNKCLGKKYADAAIQKCANIAKDCTEADSGLTNRFGTAIGKLRENAEKEVKRDEERMYAMRDSMSSVCKKLGAMFDERSFDCVFTVNFFAGDDQTIPKASRKRYAGDTFVCTQEWFGVNVTTYKENAYRETRAQTGASSAMLGSGVGTAVGLVTSGAMGRALETQKAKKELKKEEKAQKQEEKQAKKEAKQAEKAEKKAEKAEKKAEKDAKKEGKDKKSDSKKTDTSSAAKDEKGTKKSTEETPKTGGAEAPSPEKQDALAKDIMNRLDKTADKSVASAQKPINVAVGTPTMPDTPEEDKLPIEKTPKANNDSKETKSSKDSGSSSGSGKSKSSGEKKGNIFKQAANAVKKGANNAAKAVTNTVKKKEK